MRVAFVANSSWYIYNLRKGILLALREHGVEVVVISPVDDFSLEIINLGFRFIPIKVDNSGKNVLRDIGLFQTLRRHYKQNSFDFVFHYTVKPNIFGGFAAASCGLKSISVVSGRGHSFSKKNLLFTITKQLYKYSFRFSDEVWFVNKDDDEFFSRERITRPSTKTRVLPGEGVNTSHFAPLARKKNDVTTFLFSGRIIWSKGFKEYIEAARIINNRHKSVKFQVLGFFDVPNPTSLSKKEVLKLHTEGVIEYLGSTEDVRPFLGKADCVVFPSFYGEGTPRSLLEAASMEIPIITTNHIGCKEVVQHGFNGYLCESKNVNDLVSKIDQFLMLSEKEKYVMGKNSRKKIIEEFDEKFIINLYLKKLALKESSFSSELMGLEM